MAGVISDRVFQGRASRTCLFYMICCTVAVFLFWKIPHQTPLITSLILGMTGFFIYGPQALVGAIVSNLSTKKAAASAVGLTGLFGYGSTIISGWGIGYVSQHYGWDTTFKCMFFFAICATVCFALAWPAPRDTYGAKKMSPHI